ncbi:17437_t:CDS:2 [Funneliformis geosporum]|uniref:4025_t:CDS:1 n=1 Tax=Funneliformis geosporum TaxID=1117311 RepID=A0A9W4SIP0_9GLOM|nr:17437_t:CDS:2 [Funneliformis geosporum]CAI2169967.1 4025_t:CDS:2 [Funneliformis geosporum]
MSYTRPSANRFFEKIRRLLTLNPESNTGVPITGTYRTPAPGSQPKTYKRPLTKHSDLAQNYYYDRDARRNFPRLAVYTQNDVAKLIAVSNLKSIAAEGGSTQVANIPEDLSLTEIIASAPTFYSSEKLPPLPGRPLYNWKKSESIEPYPGFVNLSS